MKPRDPQTPAEWQDTIDNASFLLLVNAAEAYGMITGPKVNAIRCDEILARGAHLGYHPAPRQRLIERFLGGSDS